MTKVLFTVSNDLNTDQRMNRICKTLHEQGFDVYLIGRKRKSSQPLPQKQYKQVRLSLFFERGKLFYIELQIRLFFYLLFHSFDMVCGIDLDTILPCYFISRIKGGKCYYDAHELFTEVPEVVRRPMVRSIWLRIERFICHSKSIVKYTVSQSVADELGKRYGCSFSIIRNMPDYKSITTQADENIVLYRGAVNEGRGLEMLIEAMKCIDAQLTIAGDGDITPLLKELAVQHGVENKIRFTGYLRPAELDRVSSKARIGVNLLEQKSLNYYYSLANKFFDYVHLEIPQVCMNFPEYKRMNELHRVAILIDELTVEAIAAAINKLLTETIVYKQMQEQCKIAAKEWNWHIEQRKLIELYRLS